MAMQQFHVISVWLQHPNAGLGDLIRGTMHLCELSQKYNFKLTVDTQFHPASRYLIASTTQENREYVLQNKDKILRYINSENGDKTQLLEVMQTAMRNGRTEPMLIFTNLAEHLHVIPSAHSKWFIRSVLTPNPEFQTAFVDMCKLHNINCADKTHSIIHFRVGDDDLVEHRINLAKYKECLNVLDMHQVSGLMDDATYIISDSYWFKQFVRRVRPHLASKVIVTKPIHLSHSCEDGKHDEMIMDTMFDFYLLINARVIKTYSSYTWVSGFVRWVSHAFNVPLVNLNYEVGYNQMKLFAPTNSRLKSGLGSTEMFMFSKPKPKPRPNPNPNPNPNAAPHAVRTIMPMRLLS
jgi:hypothetical protein